MTAKARRILIVDDEPAIRMIARAALTAAGYQVAEAANVGEAEAAVAAADGPFDLILLDLTLPGENGADLIPVFRTRTPGTRILLVSGLHAEDVEHLNADGFLSKPFTRGTLLAAVQHVLGAG